MRRIAFLCLFFLLVLPGAAWASRSVAGDGTLSVRSGDGALDMTMVRGAVIGKIASGTLRVDVASAMDCDDLAVFGADRTLADTRGETPVCSFAGRDLRFRLIGQGIRFTIGTAKVPALGFSLSMVAKARGTLKGVGGGADGTFSIDGDEYASLPDDGRRIVLGTFALGA